MLTLVLDLGCSCGRCDILPRDAADGGEAEMVQQVQKASAPMEGMRFTIGPLEAGGAFYMHEVTRHPQHDAGESTCLVAVAGFLGRLKAYQREGVGCSWSYYALVMLQYGCEPMS